MEIEENNIELNQQNKQNFENSEQTKQEEIIELKFPNNSNNNKKQQEEKEEEIKFLYEQKKPIFIQQLNGNCIVCKNQAKYKCPKCTTFYCKLECYRAHSNNCTEQFYQQQVISEMKGKLVTKDETKKMKNILHDYKDMPNQQDISMEEQNEEKKLKRLEQLAQLEIEKLDFAKLTLEEQENFKQFIKDSQEEQGIIQQWLPYWKCDKGIFSLFVEEIDENLENEDNILNEDDKNQNFNNINNNQKQNLQEIEEESDEINDQQKKQQEEDNEYLTKEEQEEELLEGQMLQELEEFDKKLASEIDANFEDMNKDLGADAVNKEFSKEELFGDDKDAEKEYNEYYKKLQENQQKFKDQQNQNKNINSQKQKNGLEEEINNKQDQEIDDEDENETEDQIQKHIRYRQKMKKKCKTIINLQKNNNNNENLNYHMINIVYSLIVAYQYINGDFYSEELYEYFLSICECIGESKTIFQSEANSINAVIYTSVRQDKQSQGILLESIKDLVDVLKNRFYIVETMMHFYDILHDKQEKNLNKDENTVKDMKRHKKQRQQLNKMKNKLIFFMSYAKNISQENLDKIRLNVQNYHTEMQEQKNIENTFKFQKKLLI